MRTIRTRVGITASVILVSLLTSSVVAAWSTHPGAICRPENETVEHGYVDDEIYNSGLGTSKFYCPLVTHQDKYWNGSYNEERFSPGDQSSNSDIYVTVEDWNNDASNSQVKCRVGLHYYASASSTEFTSYSSTGTTATGRSTFSWDLDTALSTSPQWYHHYTVECELPGWDVDGSDIIAIRSRYNVN